MDLKSIRDLEILQEISANDHISQRHLSKKLAVSTGLVHLYIKRLVQKGYIRVAGIKPRRLKYLLTPRGIAEKTKLTYEFTLISYRYFKRASDDIREKLCEAVRNSQSSVVVYGTGELAELCLLLLGELDAEVVAVIDDNCEMNQFCGHPVVPKEVLGNLKFDKLVVAELDARDRVECLLNEVGVDSENICWLLDVS
jgi:DNA-binding Lrp family transcriptional regulator